MWIADWRLPANSRAIQIDRNSRLNARLAETLGQLGPTRGKFQCSQALITRSKKQTVPPKRAAHVGLSFSRRATTITIAPVSAAVA